VNTGPALAAGLLVVGLCSGLCLAQDHDLKSYTSCQLGPDFQIVQVDGPVTDFAWKSPTKSGQVPIPVEAGYRVLVTYRGDEPFGNLKVERLPKSQYVDEKASLLSSLEHFASDSGMEPKVHTETRNGLSLYGVTRIRLEGGVLSIYNLFSDPEDIVVTMYLLNAEPAQRKFNTLEAYKQIREKFLDVYTKCVASRGSARK
jgi:hypothetical protein